MDRNVSRIETSTLLMAAQKIIFACVMMIASLGLASCTQYGEITQHDSSMEVLSKPFPKKYPSRDGGVSETIGFIAPGECVRVVHEGYGKDFKYYKIETEHHRDSYVIHNSSITKCN